MRLKKQMHLLVLFVMLSVWAGASAQVDPEIQLGARGVVSFNTDILAHKTTTAVNDFSDTGLLTGFRQKLYNKFRGQLVIGFQFPDAESDLGQLFFHQTFILLEDQSNIIKLGRSRVRSAMIEFPTLRDDDALEFTDVLNPFSSGENTEDHQYGNVLEYAHIFNQRVWLRIHGEHFTETPQPPATAETDFSLNAIGFSLQYRVPPTQLWNRPLIQQVGIGFNNFLTDRPGYRSRWDRALKNVTTSFVINLKPDPIHFVDFRAQAIYNVGFEEVKQVTDFFTLTRARALATFASFRYLLRKLERPALQVALSAGYKTFPDLQNKTDQFQLVANLFYRLGDNFDAVAQVQFRQFNGDLRALYGESDTRIQFGFVYSIDQSWNNQFDDRESLLNLEHGYIP
ncbi:MAG: hypothetical protein GXO78_12315 [Calditrichaeota bacterium]|nr:hypothetical protein [Calditrichota bacterium]